MINKIMKMKWKISIYSSNKSRRSKKRVKTDYLNWRIKLMLMERFLKVPNYQISLIRRRSMLMSLETMKIKSMGARMRMMKTLMTRTLLCSLSM